MAPAELEPLARAATVRRAVRGERIVDSGDPAESIYVVASGRLKDAIETEDGGEVVHSLWEPGMLFGHVAFLAADRTRVMSVIALEPTILLVLGREPVMAFLDRRPAVVMRLVENLASTSRWQTEMIAILARRPVAERVLLRLLDLAETNGIVDPRVAVTPRLSQATLASMVGASRENVNRALAALTAAGTVRVDDGRYVIPEPAGARRDVVAGWRRFAPASGPESTR